VYAKEAEHTNLYMVYFEKAMTSKLYIRDATAANPYALLVSRRFPIATPSKLSIYP
jgi:hypothetical protein